MKGVNKNLKKLTVGAVLAAIGVAMLSLGGIIETVDLSMAALASFMCIFAVIEMGGMYPWLIFAVTSLLSIVLMPHNMGAWFYLLFFGYYPILKEKVEKLNKVTAWIIKEVIVNAAMIIAVFAVGYVVYSGNKGFFDIINSIMETNFGTAAIIGVIALVEATFVIYDLAVTRLIIYYMVKLRHRFAKFLK